MLYYKSLSVSLICLLLFFLPVVRQFLITDFKTGEILYTSSVKPSDRFSIIYIHSVNKSPVEDQFTLDDDYTIFLKKSIFKSFGAGVPSNLADGGRFEFFRDRIEVSFSNSKIVKLLLFVGVIADHHFLMNGKDIRLSELSPLQSSIHFSTEKITVWQYLKYFFKKRKYIN